MRGMAFHFDTQSQPCSAQYQLEACTSMTGAAQDAELTIATLHAFLYNKLGSNWQPLKIAFKHERLAQLDKYQTVYQCPVLFNQPGNSITFDQGLLSLPLSNADPTLFSLLKPQADDELNKLDRHHNYLSQVRILIAANMNTPGFSIQTVADYFNTTTRTLHRRLHQAGTSYKTIQQEVLMDMAKDRLQDSTLSINLLAGDLGYSEPSSFVRAFKRLTGMTPLQYRKANAR